MDGEPEGAAQQCPKCGAELLHVERTGMVIELCSACRGMWLDPGELTTILEIYRRLDVTHGAPSSAHCVRGGEEMRELVFPGTEVRIDVCPDCQGIWLDAGELELLQRHVADLVPHERASSMSQRAKVLLTEVERAETQRFSCPKCRAKLWHIEREGTIVEVCSSCEGMWFDTSELTVLLGVYRRLRTEDAQVSGISCVRCGTGLRELAFPGTSIQVDSCPDCQGVWLDRGEFERLRQTVAHLVEGKEQSLNERAEEILEGLDLAAQERARCPMCEGKLEAAFEGSVRFERCQGCRGTWLGSGDLTRVLGVSRRINADRDGEFTELPCIRCPDESLIEVLYPGTEVPIDTCPDCRGVFLEDGELERLTAAVKPAG